MLKTTLTLSICVILQTIITNIECKTFCKIDLKKDFRGYEEPLILKDNKDEIIYPSNEFALEINGGDKIRLHCGNGNFKNLHNNEETILIQCVNGNHFKIAKTSADNPRAFYSPTSHHRGGHGGGGSDTHSPDYFSCKSYVKSYVQESGNCGVLNADKFHKLISIGFKVWGSFIPIINTCFNTELKSVLWSQHSLTPTVKYHESGVKRINFIQDDGAYGGGLNLNAIYSRNHQRDIVAKILGSHKLAEKYIPSQGSSNAYFARGHLAPKGDFIYGAEQLATFHFINVAPQWQYFNGGKWEKVESSLRDYIIHKNTNSTVLTLTIGTTQLADEEGHDKDIYLHIDNKHKFIKVPKLYAKVITFKNYPSENVVVVGINQPYEDYLQMSTNDVICENICDKHAWLSSFNDFNENEDGSGYIYCCNVNDFIKYLKSSDYKHLGGFNKIQFDELDDISMTDEKNNAKDTMNEDEDTSHQILSPASNEDTLSHELLSPSSNEYFDTSSEEPKEITFMDKLKKYLP